MNIRWGSWFSRLFNRRAGIALLWGLLVVGVAVAVNVVAIRVLGSIERWEGWVQAHAAYFFAWRLCLYAATAYGWRWMRRRLREREPETESETFQGLRRAEIAAVIVVVTLEVSQLLNQLPQG